jgi:hypothetical protein
MLLASVTYFSKNYPWQERLAEIQLNQRGETGKAFPSGWQWSEEFDLRIELEKLTHKRESV